jgi:hypothetical protein
MEFLHHEQEYLTRFQPIDGVERDLVRKLIAASWREKRMDVMEGSLLELEMQKQSPKFARSLGTLATTLISAIAVIRQSERT